MIVPSPLTTFDLPCRAVVVGSTGAIGAAFVAELQAGGMDVTGLSRSGPPERHLDLEDEASIAQAAGRLAGDVPIRLVLVASGLLHDESTQPEKTYRHLDPAQLARSFRINAIGPALVAKHFLPLLPRAGKSVLAVLSARVGSIEDNRLGGWYGYRASKAALNQFVRTSAIELARQKPDALCVALHPGTVATPLSQPFRSGLLPEKLFEPREAARHMLAVLDRLTPRDSGGLFAWDGSRIPF